MVVQNVQLRSINGSQFQLLSIEPPLLQGQAGLKLVELQDVSISTTVDNWVVSWDNNLGKFVLSEPSGGGGGRVTVNGSESEKLNFSPRFSVNTTLLESDIDLNATLDNLNNVQISNPVSAEVLTFNGTNWVNATGSNSNSINLGSNTGIETINFSSQFSVSAAGSVASISVLPESFSLADLTDVELNTPVLGQVIRYDGSLWQNSTVDYNTSQFTVLNTTNVTSVELVPQDLNWISDVSITNPVTNQLLQYNGTNWINNSFNPLVNIGDSGGGYGSDFFENIPLKNLFFDYTSFNVFALQGQGETVDGIYLNFRGLLFSSTLGSNGYAQELEFPSEFDFTTTSFTPPVKRAELIWRDSTRPIWRARSGINNTNTGQVISKNDQVLIDSTAGSFSLLAPRLPHEDGEIISIVDRGFSLSVNPVNLICDVGDVFAESGSEIFVMDLDGATYEFIIYQNKWYRYHKSASAINGGIGNIAVYNEGTLVSNNVNSIDFIGVDATFNNGIWTPSDILANVSFWIEANTGFQDKSLNARPPLNSANLGVIVPNILAGNSIFRFNDTQALAYANAYDPANVSVFVVFKDDDTDQRIINISDNNGVTGIRSLFDSSPIRYRINPSDTNQNTTYTGPILSNNVWNNSEFRGSDLTHYNHGVLLGTSTSNSPLLTVSPLVSSNIVVNAIFYNTGTGVFTTISSGASNDIAEIVVIEKNLPLSVHEKVEGYLAHKYGMAADLPSGHPYKNTAPTSLLGAKADVRLKPSFGSSQTNLVEEIVVTTEVNTIVFNPSNLFFGEDYQIVLTGTTNTAANRVDVRVNGDTSNANYEVQLLSAFTSTVSTVFESSSASVSAPNNTTVPTFATCNFTTSGGFFKWNTAENSNVVSTGNSSINSISGRRTVPIPNLTSLSIVTRSGVFSTGFTARLYRLNNSTNLVNRPVSLANFTASRNSYYPVDTSGGAITATLDLTTSWFVGDRVTFVDRSGTQGNNSTGFGLNNLTLAANSGQNIAGLTTLVLNQSCQSITLQYAGSGRFDLA